MAPTVATPAMTEQSLQSLRVLVTRPEGRADALIDAITARGGKAVHIPLLAVIPLDEQSDAAIRATTTQRFQALENYQRIIAISVNALHFGLPWIKQYWSTLPPQIIWYGIGAATIAAFADYGIDARGENPASPTMTSEAPSMTTEAPAMTTEALVAASDLQQLHGERILILRGIGGREQLATVLRERGAQVDYAECYRRSEPVLSTEQLAQLQAMPFDAISVNSAETLQNLWQCLQPAARELAYRRALIAPSARVAATAEQLGFTRVIVADNAGTQATLNALMSVTKIKMQNDVD